MFRFVSQCSDMSEQKTSQSSIHAGSRATANPDKPEQTRSAGNGKTATQRPLTRSGGVGKNSSNYWLGRIYKPVNGLGVESPHYLMRVRFKPNHRLAFGLGTGNKAAAAAKAALIYNDLLTLGVEETLAKHRPKAPVTPDRIATIGEWLAEAERVNVASSTTFTGYSRALRKIAGDIVNGLLDSTARKRLGAIAHDLVGNASAEAKTAMRSEAGRIIESARRNAGNSKAKANKSKSEAKDFRGSNRFGPRSGGAQGFRAIVDEASLEVLSPRAIQDWRKAYAGDESNPAKQRSRMTSANSTIRQAMSLFSSRFIYLLSHEDNGVCLRLPEPHPFYVHPMLKHSKRGGKHPLFYEEANTQYRSRINPQEILQKAESDLATTDAPAFLGLLLAIAVGLRRHEIDALTWGQIDFRRGLVRVERTATSGIKTNKAEADVPVDQNTIACLRGFFAKVKDTNAHVVEGAGIAGGKKKWGEHYRADAAFARLIAWLRANGVNVRKPIQELRREFGSLVATQHGIYASQKVLRHSSVTTTAKYYADIKERPVVEVGAWLNNVIELPKEDKRAAK
jgi:integrase